MIKLRIRYYGKLTELAGCEVEELLLDSVSNIEVLNKKLISMYPKIRDIPLIFFANNKRWNKSQILAENTEIDCMPPFSGG